MQICETISQPVLFSSYLSPIFDQFSTFNTVIQWLTCHCQLFLLQVLTYSTHLWIITPGIYTGGEMETNNWCPEKLMVLTLEHTNRELMYFICAYSVPHQLDSCDLLNIAWTNILASAILTFEHQGIENRHGTTFISAIGKLSTSRLTSRHWKALYYNPCRYTVPG